MFPLDPYSRKNRERATLLLQLTVLSALFILPQTCRAAKNEGVIAGYVRDTSTGSPIAGALIAAYDDKGRVITSGRTDRHGYYELLVPCDALPLPEARRRGSLVSQIVRGVGKGVKMVVGLTAQAAQSVAASNAGSAAGKAVAEAMAREGSDKLATQVGGKAAERAVSGTIDPSGGRPVVKKRPAPQPVMVFLPSVRVRVVHDSHKEFNDEVASYWLEAPVVGEKRKVISPSRAWMDDIRLAPEGSLADSETLQVGMILSEFDIEPAIATPGTWVILSVKVSTPSTPTPEFRVLAKNIRAKRWIELSPAGNGRYQGQFLVDDTFPRDDQAITVLAIRKEPAFAEPFKKLRGTVQREVDRRDLWNPKKPFKYDPQLLAGRNRLEGLLTVVKPKR